ncbi:MAG: small multi-drug export protein, partial [Candidatus Hydrogenedentes bacterium]|nr:small multi-drug export protein [Candidatus Hydrogenedentota bacterium]
MKEQIVAFFVSNFSLPVATVFLATLPILELRGALPVAILCKDPLPLWQAYPLAVLGNMLPIPFIVFLLKPVTDLVRKWKYGERFVEWLFARTRRKGKNIEKYEMW